ncbi:ATP-grasp domain-containing protein [Roseisolibacter sp. H3M3-2]|uniref:ATP-grasp domain-containing protein n=1 Tax=Roseisolibacter sp. H3M3-2 TaxID=3031323 RepID=UPI0023DBF250|nr:ATP-grasp domain-containing protein [Roseisolibacter sp. H3M3-2]MDF1503474.1 ATP-grasp domain-containing protein [Roseisolibacter sp. H3M3-2]
MTTVLFLAPGYPDEMPLFVRGLSRAGAQVYGLSDVAAHELPEMTRRHLHGYLQASLRDEAGTVEAVRRWVGAPGGPSAFDRVICLWEPGVILAARIREALGVPGMGVEQSQLFRDKDLMKQAVAAAGLRVPHHRRASTAQQVREAVEAVGYPAIVKPIDGAGSMDTFRVDDARELEQALSRMGHVPEVNVEEFIEAEEFTYDTICVDGAIQYEHVGYYRPRPLIARTNEWISPQTLSLRDIDTPWVRDGVRLGHDVLKALNFGTGFTHMEWYRKSDGEVVFGEIGARPPGARTVDLMNFNGDLDLFTGYGEAEVAGTFSQPVERKYYVANVFKRAQGQGRIRHVAGLEELRRRFGDAIVNVDLLPVGAPRRDWVLTLISDGYVTVRHPDKDTLWAMADAIGTDLQLYAG